MSACLSALVLRNPANDERIQRTPRSRERQTHSAHPTLPREPLEPDRHQNGVSVTYLFNLKQRREKNMEVIGFNSLP